MITDNLAPLFAPGPDAVRFRQGTITAWNASTGANTIDVAGGTLTDVSILNTGEAIALKAGHVVGLLAFGSTWFILGRITPPGDANFASASVAFGSAGGQASNFGLSTSMATIVSSTELVVPGWADEALVHVTGSCSMINPLGVEGSFGFRVGCAGGNGGTTFVELDPADGGNNSASSRNVFTGLSGGETLTVTGEAQSLTTAWGAVAGNAMYVHAIAVYKSNV